MTDPNKKKNTESPLECSCTTDPYAELPPELRPKPRSNMAGLRKVICPGCGFKYWTNLVTDYCPECVKKGLDKKTNTLPPAKSTNGEQA